MSSKLTNPEWEALQDKCNKGGLTIAEYLRNLIKNEPHDKDQENHSLEEKSAKEDKASLEKILTLEQLVDALRKEREQPATKGELHKVQRVIQDLDLHSKRNTGKC